MKSIKLFTTLLVGLSSLPVTLVAEDTRILSFTARLVDFGDVNISQTKTKPLTIVNDGNATLNISRISLHEKIKDNYSITNWVGALAPAQSVDINITFIPTEVGAKNGLVYVHSDKTNSGDKSKLLTGNGITSIDNTITRLLRVCEDDEINCLEDEAQEEFGNVEVGTSLTRTVTIYNDGNTPLSITGLRVHEKIEDMFTIDNPSWSGDIPPAGSHDINVTYTPNDTGLQSGRIYFLTDKTATGYSGFNRKELTGTGVSTPTPCTGALSISGSGDYGIVPEGTNLSQTFQINNPGTNPLTISSVYLHPSIVEAFSIDGNWTNVIIPGRASDSIASASITINYDSTKTTEQIVSGLFYVVSSSCQGNNAKLITAESDAENPHRILNFSGIQNFVAADNNTPISHIVPVLNDGNEILTITRVYAHPNIADNYDINETSFDIPANSSHNITVTFNPNGSTNIQQGLLYIRGNNTNVTDGTMVLRGTTAP